jgi:catechol 2,3-dioxygenase-like lactoylglutathione lyase family enzyme
MIDHIILTVSDVERSLAFYEASLAPLDISVSHSSFWNGISLNAPVLHFTSTRLT